MAQSTARRIFGRLPDGRAVESIRLQGDGLSAEVLTWGAVIRDLRFDGHAPPLVLGLNSIGDYLAHSRNFGASPGRCANRIAQGRFTLDGRDYALERNERGGRNHIHGGSQGMARALWRVLDLGADRLVLGIEDPAGNAGYPGTVWTECTIALRAAALCIRYASRCDAPTPVNICHHGYFNLGHGPDVRDHLLRIEAARYLPVDADKIPRGGPQPVEGTGFDLRRETALAERLVQLPEGYDHNFCLSDTARPLRPVAWAHAPGGLELELATTEPGVQLFTAGALDCPVPGLDGRRYGPAAGFCLETQIWPDAVNQPGFPPVVLRPGEVRVQDSEYRFSSA
ncbi:aldose epimerase family protein [Paracoccus sp. (in: a-proteobacteria)]|uniref:aldose epimerase family protein n=1 Tax=Paracoccus sp. TaxID=267 RepID=UPI00321F63E2